MLQHIGDSIDASGAEDCESYTRDATRIAQLGTTNSILLVGEHNPYGADLSNQLVCWPEGCAGHRLQSKILGISDKEYLGIWRTNLCGGRGWIMADARARVKELISGIPPWKTIVLLGRKVAAAFGVGEVKPFQMVQEIGGLTLLLLPHPSGLCREWYKPGAIQKARGLLRWNCPEVLWGSL